MIILDSATRSLQIVLASAVLSNQLNFAASYIDIRPSSSIPGGANGVTNGASAVTLVPAPGISTQRQVKSFSVQNSDTASAKVSILYNDNGNTRSVFVATLNSGDNLTYEDTTGFKVFDGNGGVKQGSIATSGTLAAINRPTNGGFDSVTFAKYFPFSVWRDSAGHIQHNFDWKKWAPNPAFYAANAKTYYVSTSGSDSNNGLAWATPFLSINKAVASGNAAGVPFLVNVAGGFYQFYASFSDAGGGTVANQPCAFIAVGGRVLSSMSVPDSQTSWVVYSGAAYKVSSLIGTPAKIQRVVSLDLLDQWGDYTELTKAASLTACVATPGTWFSDSTTIYVNRFDGAAVTTANTRAFYNTQVAAQCTTSGNMYVENFDFEGGESYPMSCKGNPNGRMVFNNCNAKWSSGANAAADINWGIFDVDGAAFINCGSARGQSDGFAAHASNGKKPFVIWIGCNAHHQGINLTGVISSNAVTTHDGIRSISINGNYHHNQGGQSAHVIANTQHWSVGDALNSSLGDIAQGGTAPPSDFLADQSNASIWVDGCRSFPGDTTGTYYSFYTDNGGGAGANIYFRNCNYSGQIAGSVSPY